MWETSKETVAGHQETRVLWRGGRCGVRQSGSALSQFQIKPNSERSEKCSCPGDLRSGPQQASPSPDLLHLLPLGIQDRVKKSLQPCLEAVRDNGAVPLLLWLLVTSL